MLNRNMYAWPGSQLVDMFLAQPKIATKATTTLATSYDYVSKHLPFWNLSPESMPSSKLAHILTAGSQRLLRLEYHIHLCNVAEQTGCPPPSNSWSPTSIVAIRQSLYLERYPGFPVWATGQHL
jgi:hypothetical protein